MAQLEGCLGDAATRADAEGYFMVNYGELIDAVSRIFGEETHYLLENGWVVRGRLEEAGYLCAPDPLVERRKLKATDALVLYATNDFAHIIRTRGYKKGLMFIKFATLAFSPLSAAEIAECDTLLAQWVTRERLRRHLGALLRWFNMRRRILDARTKRMFAEIMTPADKEKLAAQLLFLAVPRGMELSTKSLHQLDRLLAMNGHEPGEVHSLLHRQSVGELRRLIPASRQSGNCDGVALNLSRLKDIRESTHKVQHLLASVWTPDAEPSTPLLAESSDCDPEPSVPGATPGNTLADLLAQRDRWPVAELQQELSDALGGRDVKLSVLLEALNDEAYDLADEAAAELEGETVHVNRDVLARMKEK